MASIWCGANRFMHTELTHLDPALARIFGWKQVPAQDAFKRYFYKFDQVKNLEVSQYFYSWIFDNFHFNPYTLDIDSSILPATAIARKALKREIIPKRKAETPTTHSLLL